MHIQSWLGLCFVLLTSSNDKIFSMFYADICLGKVEQVPVLDPLLLTIVLSVSLHSLKIQQCLHIFSRFRNLHLKQLGHQTYLTN